MKKKSLFWQLFNSNTKLPNNNNEILLPEIPFYGLGGTICRIEETPESYYKVLYNPNGTINTNKIPVPKKKTKNFNLILKDYCLDLQNYLDIYQSKYLEYTSSDTKAILTNKQFILLAVVTTLATIASLPFLVTTTWIGLIFATISAFSLYMVCDIHQNDLKKTKTYTEFKNNYENLERNLFDYQSGKSISYVKQNKTVYTEIKEVDKSNLRIFPKIKKLIKDEI